MAACESQNNVWTGLASGTCRALHVTFPARLTRALTGYFFINLGSNGRRMLATSATSVSCLSGCLGQNVGRHYAFRSIPRPLLGNRRTHTMAPSDLPISNPVFGNRGLES